MLRKFFGLQCSGWWAYSAVLDVAEPYGHRAQLEAPTMVTKIHQLPEVGFVRLKQIIGDQKAQPPIPPLFPVSRSAWWEGIKQGRFPAPCRLGPRTVAWSVESIQELIAAHRAEPTIK